MKCNAVMPCAPAQMIGMVNSVSVMSAISHIPALIFAKIMDIAILISKCDHIAFARDAGMVEDVSCRPIVMVNVVFVQRIAQLMSVCK